MWPFGPIQSKQFWKHSIYFVALYKAKPRIILGHFVHDENWFNSGGFTVTVLFTDKFPFPELFFPQNLFLLFLLLLRLFFFYYKKTLQPYLKCLKWRVESWEQSPAGGGEHVGSYLDRLTQTTGHLLTDWRTGPSQASPLWACSSSSRGKMSSSTFLLCDKQVSSVMSLSGVCRGVTGRRWQTHNYVDCFIIIIRGGKNNQFENNCWQLCLHGTEKACR